jgi:MFS family permease
MPEAMPSRDARILTIARAGRQFAYGSLSIVLAVALLREGVTPVSIGALVTVSLVGDFCGTLLIGRYADSWGRRRTLVVLAVLMALTGLIFDLTSFYPVLLVAAFCGTLGTSASETAPFLPLEQAMLAQTVPMPHQTAWYARYNLVASFAGALGGLAAGVPDVLARVGVRSALSFQVSFGLYVGLALIVVLLVRQLSPSVEAPPVRQRRAQARWWEQVLPPLPHSRAMVLRLAALFSVDALAGGLVGQTVLALFFHLRFGVPLGVLGVLFFGTNVLSALSFLAAPPLARRFGLLNTMVFTHLPSNLLLILVAVMPTFPLAALLLLLRQGLSQLDVPTRQAYTMALVAPSERTAAASVTSLARSAGSATSPVLAGALLQGALVVIGWPLLLAGTIKGMYDLVLWRVFAGISLPPASALPRPPSGSSSPASR